MLIPSAIRRRQGGWLVPAAMVGGAVISGLFGRRAQKESSNATALANAQAAQQRAEDAALQREFAQNGIRWKVADAQAAGLHPLSVLGSTGASYSPSASQVFVDNSRADSFRSMGQDVNRAITGVADFYSRQARGSAGEPYGPPSYLQDTDREYVTAISNYSPEVSYPLAPIDRGVPVPYGMVSHAEQPSMKYWSVPEIGRVIAPDAQNFSESLEGLESITGQALVLYLNRDLGKQALKWLWGQMPNISSFNVVLEAARRYAESKGVNIRRE